MPTLSTEFWIATGVAILLTAIGIGIGVAMDAKTRGEYAFVLVCFSLSWLALLITTGLWYFNSTLSWTTRSGIAAVVIAVISLLTFWGIGWATDRHERASKSEPSPQLVLLGPPFSASIPVTIVPAPNAPSCGMWMVINNSYKVPASFMIYIRLTNLQPIQSTLATLAVKRKTVNGKWITLTHMDTRVGFTFSVENDFRAARPLEKSNFIDSKVGNPIQSRGLLEGWMLLEQPTPEQFGNEWQIALTDMAGVSWTSGILESGEEDKNAAAQMQAIAVAPGIYDLTNYAVRRWPIEP